MSSRGLRKAVSYPLAGQPCLVTQSRTSCLGALATHLGFEAILGAFIAGAILRLVDPDAGHTHPLFHPKLDAIGYGFLIPVFFVTSGLTFNLPALFSSASTVLRAPLFLLALLIVRGLPAVLYRPALAGVRDVAAVGLFSVILFPVISLQLLRSSAPGPTVVPEQERSPVSPHHPASYSRSTEP